MTPTIKAVIFDMDGLMFNTEVLFDKVEHEMAERRGKVFTREIKGKIIGMKLLDAILVMKEELGMEEDPEELYLEFDLLYQDVLQGDIEEMPGLLDLLDILEENSIKKAVATSSLRRWAELTLNSLDLSSRFEAIFTGDDVDNGKPHPEIYQKAVNALGFSPENCMVLEDSAHGANAGKAAGCFVVAVPTEYTRDQNFDDADFVIDTLEDKRLLDIIKP